MNLFLKRSSLCIVLVLLLLLSACGNQQASNSGGTEGGNGAPAATEAKTEDQPQEKAKIKLLLMTGDETRKAINAKYLTPDNFKTDLPDIEVQIEESIGGDEYTNKLKTYNATGELPDVYWAAGTTTMKPIINSGSALDFLPYITADGFAEKYTEKEAIAPFTDGKLYVLQAGSDMYFVPRIFYHKEIFSQNGITVPTTFDEFMAVCKILKDKGIVPWATYGKDAWAVRNYLFQNLVMAEDPKVITDLIENKTDFYNPVCQSALAKIQKMVQEGVFQPGVTTAEYGAAQELFTSKKAAMYTMMTWALPDLAKDPDVDIMFFPQVNPSIDMSKTLQYWGGPNSGYAVNAKSKFADASVKVAEYCTVQEAKFFNIEQKAPTAIDTGIVPEAGSELLQKSLKNFKESTTKVQTLSLYAFSTKFDTEFGTNCGKLLTGKFSPEDFAKALADSWKENFMEEQ